MWHRLGEFRTDERLVAKLRNSVEVSLAADPAGQPHVVWLDGHPLRMYGAEVRVLEESHQVRLTCLLLVYQ